MSSDRYLNRELSWLDFNQRVLALARNPSIPLLARVRFLSIWASNLDEFFQVRVAGLKEQVAQNVRATPPDGLTPVQQLAEIRRIVSDQYVEVSKAFLTDLSPPLDQAGIVFTDYGGLDADDRAFLDDQFRNRVYPVVTPLAVDPAHPFPYISNLSLNLAIFVRNPETGVSRFARIKVPPILPRFIALPDGERFVPLEQVIASHLESLFPGMEILSHHVFRVTRNADIEIEEEEGGDLLLTIETELTRRRFGHVVRLEVHPDMPDDVLELLMREMGAEESDVYRVEGPIDLAGLSDIASLERPELQYETWHWLTPMRLQAIEGEAPDIFGVIREGDFMVHHPYDSFTTSVEAFVDQAARDPDVLAIKMTLYRISKDSPTMRSLIEAAESGKQVVALVELKARFDEERNIEWAQRLEDAGVHVMYGVVGLKTHSKVVLVVRDEAGAIRRYAHVGTGNYNDATARLYEDVGLFTADADIGADLSDLFNFLTGYSRQTRYRALSVSPGGVRPRMLELIRRQAELDGGYITMKMNSLVDQEMIDALYQASQAGTRIDLIVRGICCLIPGVSGLSENIRVRSIVGRYLEHSRIYRFGARGTDRSYYIGSADLMPRNLDRRVEVMAPINDPTAQFRLDEILDVLLSDDVLAWELQADGNWQRVSEVEGINAHAALQDLASARSRVS